MQHKTLFWTTFLLLIGGGLCGQGTWTQKANFGGGKRGLAAAFSIGTKGYIGTGIDSLGWAGFKKDLWEYDPVFNTWTQKANFPGAPRCGSVGFSIGTKGYFVIGTDYGNDFTDFYEWDQPTNIWVPKATFPGIGRRYGTGFAIGSKGYVGTGWDGSSMFNDFWEYDQSSDTWAQKGSFGGGFIADAVGFVIGNKGYFVTG